MQKVWTNGKGEVIKHDKYEGGNNLEVEDR